MSTANRRLSYPILTGNKGPDPPDTTVLMARQHLNLEGGIVKCSP